MFIPTKASVLYVSAEQNDVEREQMWEKMVVSNRCINKISKIGLQ